MGNLNWVQDQHLVIGVNKDGVVAITPLRHTD